MAEVTASVAPAASPAADPTKQQTVPTVKNAPFQIKALGKADLWLKAFIYGKHGSGKTDLAGTAVDVPEMNDVLFISAEAGDLTLQNSQRIQAKNRIMTIPVDTFTTVGYIHDFLVAHCKFRDANDINGLKRLESQVTGIPIDQIEEPKKFKTVIIDSLTEVEAYSMYSLLGVDASKVMISADMDVADWPIFRKNFEMVKLLCRSYRNLPMHVIFVAAQSYTQDETKKFHYTPQLTGKLSTALQGQVDLVGWITTGPSTPEKPSPRRLYVQPVSDPMAPKFDAKIRNGAYALPYFEDPVMADIMKAMGLTK